MNISEPNYRSVRQRWVGDALTFLETKKILEWRFEYQEPESPLYHIGGIRGAWAVFRQAPAEVMIMTIHRMLGNVWEPVPNPGTQKQLDELLRRLPHLKVLNKSS